MFQVIGVYVTLLSISSEVGWIRIGSVDLTKEKVRPHDKVIICFRRILGTGCRCLSMYVPITGVSVMLVTLLGFGFGQLEVPTGIYNGQEEAMALGQ